MPGLYSTEALQDNQISMSNTSVYQSDLLGRRCTITPAHAISDEEACERRAPADVPVGAASSQVVAARSTLPDTHVMRLQG